MAWEFRNVLLSVTILAIQLYPRGVGLAISVIVIDRLKRQGDYLAQWSHS